MFLINKSTFFQPVVCWISSEYLIVYGAELPVFFSEDSPGKSNERWGGGKSSHICCQRTKSIKWLKLWRVNIFEIKVGSHAHLIYWFSPYDSPYVWVKIVCSHHMFFLLCPMSLSSLAPTSLKLHQVDSKAGRLMGGKRGKMQDMNAILSRFH